MKIIKIGAQWCPACLITNNSLSKFLKNYSDFELESLDYDYDEDLVKKYNVGETLPVLIFFDNDKELFRLIGEKSFKEIEKAVKENI